MTKVKSKEHYRRMNTKIPTFSFRLDKEEMEKLEEIAKNLQISKSTLGRSMMRSMIKGAKEKKLEISSNDAKDTFAIKFCEPMNIETPKISKPKSKALKFAEEAYKLTCKNESD